ncbi:MAG: hypothetical protein LAT76_02860 [Schleiferiaceae bacterium]|nr:hypothetical protein [Schleiferiaceae bacterium]
MKKSNLLFVFFCFSMLLHGQNEKKNSLAITFLGWDSPIGINYHRNITPWFGVTAASQMLFWSTYSGRSIVDFPAGEYSFIHHIGADASFVSFENLAFPDGSHAFGVERMFIDIKPSLGVFVQKQDLFMDRLNVRFSSYINSVRKSSTNIHTRASIDVINRDTEETFIFHYNQYEYSRYWTNLFFSFEFQVDYSFYNDVFAGMALVYNMKTVNAEIIEVPFYFTIGKRF